MALIQNVGNEIATCAALSRAGRLNLAGKPFFSQKENGELREWIRSRFAAETRFAATDPHAPEMRRE